MSDLLNQIVFVVPCYNAGDRVMPVLEKLVQQGPRVLVVDDGSTDGCLDGVDNLDVECLRLPENRGKGFALVAGFRHALEDDSVTAVGAIDADGQHDPNEVPKIVEAFMREDADLVIGARNFDDPSVPKLNRFGNRSTIRITSFLMGAKLPDTQSGFRLYSRRFLEKALPKVKTGRYETEMDLLVRAVRWKYKVVSVPIQTIYEEGNRSSHFKNVPDATRIIYRLLSTLYYSWHQE